MAFTKLLETSIPKDEKFALNNNTPTIQGKIADNNLKKGEIAFFDENGNRLRSKTEGNNIIFSNDENKEVSRQPKPEDGRLIIPTGTNRVVANCDIDITGLNPSETSEKLDNLKKQDELKHNYKLNQPKVLQIYVDGNVTGKDVIIPDSEIRATGNVDLTSSSKKIEIPSSSRFDPKTEFNLTSKNVTVVSGGDTKLDGFKEVKIIGAGKKTTSNCTISELSHTARISQGRYTPSRSACTAIEL